jgi:hypothetical protein
MRPTVVYKVNPEIPTAQVVEVYESSGIRRPTNDPDRIQKMYANSNLVVSAWHGEKLVGVGRALTDFSYCCYVSDLAVRKEYQNNGVGREILALLRQKAGPQCVFILRAAPSAKDYYPKIGMIALNDCFHYPRQC